MKKLLRVCFLWVGSLPFVAQTARAETGAGVSPLSWLSGLYQGIVPPFQRLAVTVLGFLPEIVGALVIVTIGALIAITVVLAVDYSSLLANSSELVGRLLGYIPRVVAAIFVSILGVLIANFFGALVRLIAANLNIEQSEGLSRLTRLAIVIFTGIVALRELGVTFSLTGRNLETLFLAVSLALALSFGLGGKDIAAKYLAGVVKKCTKEA